MATIIEGMERAQSDVRPQVAYQLIREYRLFGAKSSSSDSEVVAEVDFRPPSSKHYNILPAAAAESRLCAASWTTK